jgi:DNA-binding transcriptional LysR family regulator
MEMHQVRYFLAVAEHLNFTRAAERLHIAQPSLTRAIQKLEEELGGRLFRRERANTHLTELGRTLRPHLEATFQAAERAKQQAQSFRERELRHLTIGVGSSACPEVCTDLLARLMADNPDVDIRIETSRDEEVGNRLAAGELEAAVIACHDVDVAERLTIRVLHEEPYVLAFQAGHRFTKSVELTLEALEGEPLVARLRSGYEDALASAMRARGVTRSVRHESDDGSWLVALARAGLGCLVLPLAAARASGLTFRPFADLPIAHRVALATVPGRRHSPALAGMMRRADARRSTRGVQGARVAAR